MQEQRQVVRVASGATKPRQFVFVLLDNFTMLSFASALESLRIANRMSDKTLYAWRLVSESGAPVACSAGTVFQVDGGFDELSRDDTIMVCGGIEIQASSTKKLLAWLRREARKGLKVGGLCTAAYSLAKAGLLDSKRATIHWENSDSFAEEFTEVNLTKSVFVVDGNRMTTAGGTSSIDLMLKLIADEHGEDLANAVADQLRPTTPLRSRSASQSGQWRSCISFMAAAMTLGSSPTTIIPDSIAETGRAALT